MPNVMFRRVEKAEIPRLRPVPLGGIGTSLGMTKLSCAIDTFIRNIAREIFDRQSWHAGRNDKVTG